MLLYSNLDEALVILKVCSECDPHHTTVPSYFEVPLLLPHLANDSNSLVQLNRCPALALLCAPLLTFFN